MTREEAIKALGLMEHVESIIATYEPGGRREDTTVRKLKEACRMAAAVLRAKLDRSRWEGCEFCRNRFAKFDVKPCGNGDLDIRASYLLDGSGPGIVLFNDSGVASGYFDIKFCPACGRPLTEDTGMEPEEIKTLLAEREAAWISVGDRLPEFYDWVLVAVESVAGPLWIATAYRTRLVSGDWYWWWFGYPSSIGNVTHWMPLPAPPDRQQAESLGGKAVSELTLKSLCGEHFLSGVEMTSEEIDRCFGKEPCTVLLFTLDGVTYRMTEDPDDGYRSYCDDITVSEKPPRYSFPPVRVICSMMENTDYENNDCIVMRDAENGKTILEAGTKNYDDWYPYCHFSYTPENMACNQ